MKVRSSIVNSVENVSTRNRITFLNGNGPFRSLALAVAHPVCALIIVLGLGLRVDGVGSLGFR